MIQFFNNVFIEQGDFVISGDKLSSQSHLNFVGNLVVIFSDKVSD